MKKRIVERILDWFYPPKCILCETLLPLEKKERFLCEHCKQHRGWLEKPVCQKCGGKIGGGEILCQRCKEEDFIFEKGIAVFSYQQVKPVIAHFKFKEFKRDAIPLSMLMTEYLETFYPEIIKEADLLIPVPMHEKKKRQRGFNQAELLGEGLGKRIGIPCLLNNLRRIRETTPQSKLSSLQRKENLKGAFDLLLPDEIRGKTVLLIDDIFTTGTTVNECAKVLYQGGAKKVIFFGLSVVEHEEDNWNE